MPTAEILSQGDEVVTGQTVDSNAAWLSTWLTDLGLAVIRHTTVGDDLEHLVGALEAIAGHCDLCIGTGGLGPTTDDLTAEAVARAFALPLEHDPIAMAAIEAMYARSGRPMPEINRKQAMLPRGCVRLDNHWGTAPGFAVVARGTLFCFLPGVPREMREMTVHRVAPLVRERLELRPGRLVTFRTTGIGESDLQSRIDRDGPLPLPAGAVVGYRTALPENHFKIRFPAGTAEERIRAVVEEASARIGAPLFGVEGFPAEAGPGGGLAEVVGRELAAAGATVATAESCTGGRLAAMITAVPGASTWFLEGVVAYSNAAKVHLVGVDPAIVEAHGAVSEPVARQLAEGIRARCGATWGLSTTGVAGPTGGTPEKPVGTVHVAVAGPEGTTHRRVRLPGDRDRVQVLAAAAVLDLLRRRLQGDATEPGPTPRTPTPTSSPTRAPG